MHAKKKMKGNHYIAHRLDACLDPGFRRQHVHRQAARLSAPQELNREQSGQRAVYQELFSTDWVSDSLENFGKRLLGLECEWLLTAHRRFSILLINRRSFHNNRREICIYYKVFKMKLMSC